MSAATVASPDKLTKPTYALKIIVESAGVTFPSQFESPLTAII